MNSKCMQATFQVGLQNVFIEKKGQKDERDR